MAEPQHTHVACDSNESSVLFNLRDLMRMETKRIADEEAAARAAAGRASEARAEQERRARESAEREALAVEQREREARAADDARARAHEATLLRIRSEAATREREESQRLALEHERALLRLRRDARRGQIGRTLGLLVASVAIAGAACYAVVARPALQSAHAIAAEHARQTRALNDALVELERARARTDDRSPADHLPAAVLPAPAPPAAKPVATAPVDRTPRGVKTVRPVRKPVADRTFIEIEQLGEGDDPLEGLPEASAPGKRSKPASLSRP